MRKIAVLIISITVLFIGCALADPGHFSLETSYGIINNFKYWNSASSESGTVLKVSYQYDFTDYYTAALEFGFIADQNVFKEVLVSTLVQTGAFFNVSHLFYRDYFGPVKPYLLIGTGLYGSNCFWKKGTTYFQFGGSDVSADLNAGLGMDFKVRNLNLNLELTMPALIHTAYLGHNPAYIISLGGQLNF
ncbi:MAG: hypothetical protein WCW67_05785 [Candidatus Margulisiibacteriota bacterium]|jgi:hypothetical protein